MVRRRLVAGLCGLASPAIGISSVLIASTISREFSWERNALSDLGVAEPWTALLFNGSLIASGALFIIFLTGLSEMLGRGRARRAALFCLLAGGASLMLVGVFTLEYEELHAIVSGGYFILLPAGITLIGISAPSGLITHSAKRLSLFLGPLAVASLIATLPLLRILGIVVGFAVPELLESLILSSWTIYISVKLLKSRERYIAQSVDVSSNVEEPENRRDPHRLRNSRYIRWRAEGSPALQEPRPNHHRHHPLGLSLQHT